MRGREAVLLATIVLAAGCDYHSSKPGSEVSAVNRPVGYAEVREKVLKASCIDCHRTANPQLDTYATASKAAQAIRHAVFDSQTMPKRGSMTVEQKAILLAWLNQNTPEGEPVVEPSPQPTGTPVKATWAEVKTKVLDVACNSCHFPGNPEQLSDLTNLEFARATIGTTLGLSMSNLMPPPDKARPLADDQKRLLSEWWIAGLPEN